MKIGNNLRTIRGKMSVTQQEIADFLGVERKTYMSWETGTADIKSSYIPKLAEFLKVEINDLFRDLSTGKMFNQLNTAQKDITMDGIVVLITDKEAVNELVQLLKKRFDMSG